MDLSFFHRILEDYHTNGNNGSPRFPDVSFYVKEHGRQDVVAFAISLCKAFVQLNYGGKYKLESNECLDELDELTRKHLELLSGEDCIKSYIRPCFVLISWRILDIFSAETQDLELLMCKAKCVFLIQRCMSSPSDVFHGTLIEVFSDIDSLINAQDISDNVEYYLFKSNVLIYYNHTKDAQVALKAAEQKLGLKWKFSGSLGKRTKFQEHYVSQLSLEVEEYSADSNDTRNNGLVLPENVKLDDDTVLDEVQLENVQTQRVSSAKIQCALLSQCAWLRFGKAISELDEEEMTAIIYYIISSPQNAAIQVTALYYRSILEIKKTRKMARSMGQLESLIKFYEEGGCEEGLALFWSFMMPSKYDVISHLAEQYKQCGLIKSAQQIYEKLEDWENVALCSAAMNETNKAVNLFHEFLEKDPNNPKYYCVLAELKQDEELWKKSWQVSGNRYARAMRMLGFHYLRKKRLEECCECFHLALRVNSLFEGVWFSYGCALMELSKWEDAREAFLKCVSLDSSNGEAWNNLAAMNLKLSKKLEAFECFKQSVKEKQDSVRIWQNLLYLSIDLEERSYALTSLEKLCAFNWSLKSKLNTDSVRAVVELITADEENADQRKLNRLEKVLKEFCMKESEVCEAWNNLALLYQKTNSFADELQCLEEGYRSMSQSSLGQRVALDERCFNVMAEYVVAFVTRAREIEHLADGIKATTAAAALRSISRIGERKHPDNQMCVKLSDLLILNSDEVSR